VQFRLSLRLTAVALSFMMCSMLAATHAQMGYFDPDEVQCGYDRHQNVAALSAEDLGSRMPPVFEPPPTLPAQTTSARDPIPLDFSRSKNFVGHVGGGGGVRILYDPRHRIIAICGVEDTLEDLVVVPNTAPPGFAVAHADLSRVATAHGLHLGSTVADVRRVYGRAPLVSFGHGHRGLAYQRFVPMPSPSAGPTSTPFGIYTSFEVRNDHVVGITRSTGF